MDTETKTQGDQINDGISLNDKTNVLVIHLHNKKQLGESQDSQTRSFVIRPHRMPLPSTATTGWV